MYVQNPQFPDNFHMIALARKKVCIIIIIVNSWLIQNVYYIILYLRNYVKTFNK